MPFSFHRKNHVPDSLQYGPCRLTPLQNRNPTHRFCLRQHLHESDDSNGIECSRNTWKWRIRTMHTLGGETPPVRIRPVQLALQSWKYHHHSLPETQGDHLIRVRVRRQLIVGKEMLRSEDCFEYRKRWRMVSWTHVGKIFVYCFSLFSYFFAWQNME